MKQAIKKKGFAKPTVTDIRSIAGFADDKTVTRQSSAEKPLEFIVLDKAFEEATQLPGIPLGYLSIVGGWSNTGKSTLVNCIVAACQRQGILPVIFDTENNFDFSYAKDCGMEFEEVLGERVDEETGEIIPNAIVDYRGYFLYYNSVVLADMCGMNDYSTGKQTKTKRKQAVLEDIAYVINDLLDKQDEGKLKMPLCFIWDSIGSIGSYKSYTSKTGNNMFDAGAISQAFSNIINNRIPSSKSVGCEYTNTMFCVNKIWNDSMNSMGGAASIEYKGGKTFYYGARLILHVGGVAKASTKRLTCTYKGETINYGIITKIKGIKNQLPSPWNILRENTFCCVHNGIISEDDLDEYKKTSLKELLKKLESSKNSSDIDIDKVVPEDVIFTEEETEEM
nr:MAG TPA: Protein recA [Bacteriophage sp.]